MAKGAKKFSLLDINWYAPNIKRQTTMANYMLIKILSSGVDATYKI
jgi:hypothetical protein